jgi:pimeloyl-ACP methyl ester carboxylesterase
MDFLLKRTDIDRNKIIVFGRSLGGAVAVHLKYRVNIVKLESQI